MSLGDFAKIKVILNELIEKNTNDGLSPVEIDYQFSFLLNEIEKFYSENKFYFLFDWIYESIKKEIELTELYKKAQNDETNDKKDLIQLLILKTNLIHSKIIEMVADDIFLSYMDYIELKGINELELAIKSKILTLGIANSFILYLSENRKLNEVVYDSYIEIIHQALKVFM
jgi:hypothetical protein